MERIKQLVVNNKVYSFQLYDIQVLKMNIDNTFRRYKKSNIGEYVFKKKLNGDKSYKGQLNPYGDHLFCKFKIDTTTDPDALQKRGIYGFVVNGDIQYVGRCRDSFKKRFSSAGYGGISPKNCYKGGQSTNCHINSCVNCCLNDNDKIQIGLIFITDKDIITSMEKRLSKITIVIEDSLFFMHRSHITSTKSRFTRLK